MMGYPAFLERGCFGWLHAADRLAAARAAVTKVAQ